MRFISFFPSEPRVNFMGMRLWTYIISGAMFVISILIFALRGLNLGIDFTGGTLLQIHIERGASISQIRSAAAAAGLGKAEIQTFGEANEFVVKYQENKDPEEVVKAIEASIGSPVRLDRNEQVGPRIGSELREQALIALGIGLLLMLVYIWIRFNLWFGLAAILALFHDVVITMGIYTLLGFEITSATVAAVLTIVGYSINDSIIISDRIREMMKSEEKERLDYKRMFAIFNQAVNATLSRTVLTAGTTLLVLVAILILAGPMIFDFAFALTIGIFVGTYSSIFVVAALVLDWTGKKKPRAEKT
ncbi:MAG: protein translocase subunit SecF [candidate division WOR-3 bacterium]